MIYGIIVIAIIIAILAYLLFFNLKTVEKITANDDYVEKKVAVAGLAKAPIQIGQLSGYTLFDTNGDAIIIGFYIDERD